MRIYSKIIQLLTIVLFSTTAHAQPANDDCSGAINIGPLPLPGACIGGIQDGAPITLNNQTTVGATSPNPYVYQTACQGVGDMTVFALDTWYVFTASGTTVNVSISGYNNAEMAIYSGTCGNLLGLGCSINGTMVVNQIVAGQTYYMQISGNTTLATDNNFSINIDNDIDCNDCLTASSLTASPQPVNGGYTPGQVVSFCYTVSNFNEINTNWFHGVQISLGAGWTGTFSNITPAADCNVDVTPGAGNAGAGVWSWYPGGVTSSANNTVWPAGFYYDNANVTGNDAGNNFGDPGNCGWTFCWDLTVSSTCLNGASLNVNVNTTGDGESGSWASPGCVDDPSTVFAAVQLCCPLTATNTGAYCVGGTIQLNGTGGGTYSWTGPNGFLSTLQNPTLPATIAAAGVYTLEINNAGCISTTTTTVVVNPTNTVGNASTNPTLCVNTAISPNITFTTSGATGIGVATGLPAGVTATFAGNTITVSGTPTASGTFNYSIPLTGGCGNFNATGTITVLPSVTPTFTQLGPYCPNSTADLLNTTSTNLPAIIGVWNPATISTAAIGTVTYTFTSNPGQCANNTTMDITVVAAPIPVIAVNQTSGCVPLTVTFTTTNFPTAQYSWTVNGSVFSNSANTTYTFNQGGCYDIELLVSANGCSSSVLQNDLICVENNPVASFVPSATTFFDNTQNILFTNNSVGATSYSWNFGDQQNSTLENPNHTYSNINGNVLVTLTATSPLGCTDEYSVVIEYVEETIFYVPNAFTPDEDEYNQTWGPVFTQGFDPFNFDLFIYDRWGELIWESHDASVGWDGTYQGALQIGALGMSCQEGVYTWKINYKPKETDEKKVVVGHLTLLR